MRHCTSASIVVSVLTSWAVKNQPCPWMLMERLFGLNTQKFSRQTWKQWGMLKLKMESDSLLLWKIWAAVKYILRLFSTILMEGKRFLVQTTNVLSPSTDFKLSFGLEIFCCCFSLILCFSCNFFCFASLMYQCFCVHHLPGLWLYAGMANTSFTRLWHWEIRVLVQHRSLHGHMILQSKWSKPWSKWSKQVSLVKCSYIKCYGDCFHGQICVPGWLLHRNDYYWWDPAFLSCGEYAYMTSTVL